MVVAVRAVDVPLKMATGHREREIDHSERATETVTASDLDDQPPKNKVVS